MITVIFLLLLLSFTRSRFSSVTPGLWSDGQFHAQSLALIVAGVINRGIDHVVDVVHQTGHVLW